MTNAEPRDPISAVTHEHPYAYYARLRRERPLAFDDALGLWVAAGAAAVRAALAHPQLRVRPAAEPVPAALAGTPLGEVFALLVRMNDGDFHQRHRPAVQAQAAKWDRAGVTDAASAAVRELAGRVAADRWLVQVPAQAMARLLGVPPGQRDMTVQAVLDVVAGIAPQATPRAIEIGNSAADQLMAQGERLGLDRPGAANRIALMQQSVDATAALAGNTAKAALAAAAPPPQLGAWRELVAQVLVADPPVHNTRRFAAADLVLDGQAIRAGQGVLVLLASAVQEEASPALAFGSAAHACPGAAIAAEIAAAALCALHEQELLRRMFGRPAGYRPLPNARIPAFES
ncbi:cytochrome P450 [Ramlibacter solisilvae]|uniref:Cytochrome P450 n=1 Tax=Ramlibacter tataouinensis TaxID=94132 RepID=A0A127JP39_9BURK|nr:hypothetical protein [Ramlibacter tataouinensis]AMO21741.1 hypothetical protein UC35_01205 [Ramlibacter tataouinensis]